MRKSLVALLLVLGAVASSANLALASIDEDLGSGIEGLKLMNAQMASELKSRAARLGTSAAGPANDTLWVGYTPGQVSASNWWGVYAGFGKDGYNRPTNGVPHLGLWDWETPAHGDSLQGWWPLINLYASTGNQNRTDYNRPWWALDFGNMANYTINQGNGRTYGVIGVWHRDAGLGQAAPAGKPTPEFVAPSGSFAAWMGLRAHGDNSYSDAATGNPFNEDVLMYVGFNAAATNGNDQGFPGYGSQMDQMLYRDIDFAGKKTSDLTVKFKFRTVLSTGATFTTQTRTGWYDSDPLGATSGLTNQQRGNFISSSDAGDPLAPRDSFMVYIGSGVEDNDWLPAAGSLGQLDITPRAVTDKQRRWFGEVLHWDRDSATAPPKYYKELLSVSGVWPAGKDSTPVALATDYVDTTFTISNAALAPYLLKNNKIRLVFRVKTNRGFDDQGAAFSSNKRGAVVVDHVRYTLGVNPEVNFGDFENASDINNDVNVSAVAAWKSTGKPPGVFFHTHLFSDLQYDDLCGRKGDISRVCNMSGVVISMGDHDAGEAGGGTADFTAQRERNDGVMSPTIQLAGPYNIGGKNIHGFLPIGSGQGDIEATEDYYVAYDVYGDFDPFDNGTLWRYSIMSYPGNAKASHGSYPAWGQMRFPGFIIFNPDPQCLQDIEPFAQLGLMRTSNAGGIPDSVKVMLGKTQQCFRFGVSAGCAPTTGHYYDNASFALIDGLPAQLTADIWQWINDAFPRAPTTLPTSANFDTTAAEVRSGLNVAQTVLSDLRYDVPGDTTAVSSSGNTARVDMVFRILPGPGNYEPVGRPGGIGTITRRPDNRAVVTKGDNSFWDAYRQDPGPFASPNAITLHHNAPGGWDPNVWNSARCDTAELNLFARQVGGSANVLGGPGDFALWMSAYHESDSRFNILGINHRRCFVTGVTAPTSSVTCDTIPQYISDRPEHADVVAQNAITKEHTKIIPDFLLTPGSHVEYFFRDQKDTKTPGAPDGFAPDTNLVLQVATEGNTDGHRWQEFSVLPNLWKRNNYRHPVTGLDGTGLACMLVVDNNDRRGNERVWKAAADTIGSVPARYWGAHDGYHAVGADAYDVGGGNLSINDPENNRNGKTGAPGWVSEHIGQAGSGTSWDMYQCKASESLTTGAGSMGSRLANSACAGASCLVANRRSFQGPTPAMLDRFYNLILWLSGDLNSGVMGPFSDKSQNDAGIPYEWLGLTAAEGGRGIWHVGDGFIESNWAEGPGTIQDDYNFLRLGASIEHTNYIQYSGNTDDLAGLRTFKSWWPKPVGGAKFTVYGMRNLCLWTNDVLKVEGIGLPVLGEATAQYEKKDVGGQIGIAGIYKRASPASRWVAVSDGWDLEHLTNIHDVNTRPRNAYFYSIFANVWRNICTVQGTPIVPLDVPNVDAEYVNFVNLRNNPLARGQATIHFGLARADRVEVKIFDVGGRLVRTLADRQFTAGPHDLVWDGVDNSGRQVARGVYFTRVKYAASKFVATPKLTVLK